MTKLCDECETVAHCTKHGCVPKKEFREVYVPEPVVPDVLNPKDENPAYAAGWNDCRAEMLRARKP